MFDTETFEALRTLRLTVRTGLGIDGAPREAFEQLDKAGVFAALDEQAETAKAEKLLIESAAGDIAEQHGARDHETRDPITYLRTVRAAQVKSLSEAPFAQEQQTGPCSCDPMSAEDGYTIKTPWFHHESCPKYAPAPDTQTNTYNGQY
jgi:hypothetical protein